MDPREFFQFSDNPDANYIMIEPNVKYMISGPRALAYAPTPWYLRPPPRPNKDIPVDKMRFLPTRRLQNAFESVPWVQTVGDDLDSFTYVFIHTLLFRGHQRGDPCTARIGGYYSMLGHEHPKKIMDLRDALENTLWIIGEDVKKVRADGKEPDGKAVAQFAEPLYRVTKVNVRHHGQERELAHSRKQTEGMKERAAVQYEEYLKAWGPLKEAIDEGFARKAEEKRKKKAEKEARKAEKAKEAEGASAASEASGVEADASPTGDEGKPDAIEGQHSDVATLEGAAMDIDPETPAEAPAPAQDWEGAQSSTASASASGLEAQRPGVDGIRDESEPPSKRARIE